MAYPTDIYSQVDVTGATSQATDDHAARHNAIGADIEAIETTLGTNSGTSVLMNATAGKFAVMNSGGTLNDGVLGTPAITGGTINMNAGTINNLELGTPSIVAGTSGTTTLTEPRIGAVLRQDITTNAYKPNTGILTGWGQFVGNGTANLTGTITFGITFAEPPIIIVSGKPAKSGTALGTTLDNLNAVSNDAIWGGHSSSRTQFIVNGYKSTNFSTANVYGYTWIAIGQI